MAVKIERQDPRNILEGKSTGLDSGLQGICCWARGRLRKVLTTAVLAPGGVVRVNSLVWLVVLTVANITH